MRGNLHFSLSLRSHLSRAQLQALARELYNLQMQGMRLLSPPTAAANTPAHLLQLESLAKGLQSVW